MKTAMGLAAGGGAVLVATLWMAGARGGEVFSPRGYCRTTGGEVVETSDLAVYVCCYADRQRCLKVDERSHTSVRVSLPDVSGSGLPVAKRASVE